MEKEKIEQAAIRMLPYSDEECADSNYVLGKNVGFKRGFTAGARWRINEAWHEAEKDLPEYDKLVLAEYETGGIKDYVFSHRSDNPYVKTNEQGFAFYIEGVRITRWAYLDDLLPDTRKEAVQ